MGHLAACASSDETSPGLWTIRSKETKVLAKLQLQYMRHGEAASAIKKLLTNSTSVHKTWLSINIATYTAVQDASDDRRWQLT